MANLQAVIFDLDGLMVDSEPLAHRAWRQVLAAWGCEMDERAFGRLIGHRLAESAQMVVDIYNLPLPAAELAAREEAAMMALLPTAAIPVMPGLPALLDALNQRGLPWGVATSSGRAYAHLILQRLNLVERCRALATGEEVAHPKPAPDVYWLAASRLGTPPHLCLALEDSVPGARAAIAAGMVTIAVPNNGATAADFPFAHHVFGSLAQVAGRLDELLQNDR
ncbi:MAG: HAD family phosphatase [Chloroflexota bacterium]